jgi:ABC-type branched-subunit amino acid transport system permease subunit
VTPLERLSDEHMPAVLGGFAVASLGLAALVPGTAATLARITVLAVLGLSFDVVLRRMGTPALFQPAVVGCAAWAVAALLGANQSAAVALAAALLIGAVLAPAPLLLAGSRNRHALVAGALALSVATTAALPAPRGFAPPVFIGVNLGSHTAALACALLVLIGGGWGSARALRHDFGRWLAVWRAMPELADRSGVAPGAVAAAGLALSGALAGAAAWAGVLGTLGMPAGRPADPAAAFAWLLVPLAGGSGPAGAVAGAALLVGLDAVAGMLGIPVLALAGPAVALLLWRRA